MNFDNFTSGSAPLIIKVTEDPNTFNVTFKAAAKANLSIPREEFAVGEDGKLSQHEITELDSYMKVWQRKMYAWHSAANTWRSTLCKKSHFCVTDYMLEFLI